MLVCPVASGQHSTQNPIDQDELRKSIFQTRVIAPMVTYVSQFKRALVNHVDNINSDIVIIQVTFVFNDWNFSGTCQKKKSILDPKDYDSTETKFRGFLKVTVTQKGKSAKVLIPSFTGTIRGARKVSWERKPKLKPVMEAIRKRLERE